MKRVISMLVAVLFFSATTMAQVQPTEKKTEKTKPGMEEKTGKKEMKKKPMHKMKGDTSSKKMGEKKAMKKPGKKMDNKSEMK